MTRPPSSLPTVSVVLTTFNRAHVLGQTIESILAQSFSDFELIVADDASQDSTASVVAVFAAQDPRVRYLPSGLNLGMPGNLNRGIGAARGEYIANLHDGDVYSPVLLQRWLEALTACPNALFVFNAYSALSVDGLPVKVFEEPLDQCNEGSDLLRIFFSRRNFDSPVWGTTMVRSCAYRRHGLFDGDYGFYADVDMWLRLAGSGEVAYVAEPLIGLPAREALPRQVATTFSFADRRTVRRMFWNARRRAVQAGLASRAEYLKHFGFAIQSEARVVLIKSARPVRTFVNWPTRRVRGSR